MRKDVQTFTALATIYAIWSVGLYRYIPTRQYIRNQLDLDYSYATPWSHGKMYTYTGGYALELDLTGPEVDTNFNHGNFMTEVAIADAYNMTTYTTRKLGLVPFSSTWSRMIKDSLLCVAQFFGFFRPEWGMTILLSDNLRLRRGYTHYRVAINTNRLHLSSAVLWVRQHKHSWIHFILFGVAFGCYLVYTMLMVLFIAKLIWKRIQVTHRKIK